MNVREIVPRRFELKLEATTKQRYRSTDVCLMWACVCVWVRIERKVEAERCGLLLGVGWEERAEGGDEGRGMRKYPPNSRRIGAEGDSQSVRAVEGRSGALRKSGGWLAQGFRKALIATVKGYDASNLPVLIKNLLSKRRQAWWIVGTAFGQLLARAWTLDTDSCQNRCSPTVPAHQPAEASLQAGPG